MRSYFLIFGFGYTAKAFATKLISEGFSVVGTKRTPYESSGDIPGLELIDFESPHLEECVRFSTRILVSIPPVGLMGDMVLIKYGDLIRRQAPHLEWLGYLSSTGVYGDHQGRWVTEETTCVPHTLLNIARLEVEKSWLSFAKANQLPLHIFRFSGIYGPQRNALERILAGKPYSIFKKGHMFSRVHVEDIVAALFASIKRPNPLAIYNVSDDEPAAAYIVDNYAANLLHREPPPLIQISRVCLSPMEKELYSNNRRVSNLKIKEDLEISFKYPTFREGLTHIWRNDLATK